MIGRASMMCTLRRMEGADAVKTVVVTGSAGRVGQAVVLELLRRGHLVRGFDQHPSPNLEQALTADLADTVALAEVMARADTLVHLAATPDDVEDVVNDLFPPNITGLYNVLEAARKAGVQRLVLASSGQVNWFGRQTGPWPIDEHAQVTPRSWYAATKMFLESIGYSFSVTHGMSVIVARMGWCPRDERQVAEIGAEEYFQDVYLSPGDAGRFFACAVEAPGDISYSILYPTSRPRWTMRYDLRPAKALTGYEPEDQWPEGTEVVLGR